MKLAGLLLIILLIIFLGISSANAHVTTSNAYYTNCGEVYENGVFQNINYENHVKISQDKITSSSEGRVPDSSEEGIYKDRISIQSMEGNCRADLEMDAKNLQQERAFTAGKENSMKFKYSIEGGETKGNYFNSFASVHEDTATQNVHYEDSIKVNLKILQAKSTGCAINDSEPAIYDNTILIDFSNGSIGADLQSIAEKDFDYKRSFKSAAQVDQILIDHSFDSGVVESNYFNDHAFTSEKLITQNVEYTSRVRVLPDEYGGRSTGETSNDCERGSFDNSIVTLSEDGIFGASLGVNAGDLQYKRTFMSGEDLNEAKFSHYFESGYGESLCYNENAQMRDKISAMDAKYQASFLTGPESIEYNGAGQSIRDCPGALSHEMDMLYNGELCEIVAAINYTGPSHGTEPIRYAWDTFAYGNESRAIGGFNGLRAYDGNREMDLVIEGKSLTLDDKIAGPMYLERNVNPGIRHSQKLYMIYNIDRQVIDK